MKYRTVTQTERIGEKISEIDWTYNFLLHFGNYCTDDRGKQEICDRHVDRLCHIYEAFIRGDKVCVTTHGGNPKFGYHKVIDLGMYDGWPYWKPVPSIQVMGPLGAEWQSFCLITDIMV